MRQPPVQSVPKEMEQRGVMATAHGKTMSAFLQVNISPLIQKFLLNAGRIIHIAYIVFEYNVLRLYLRCLLLKRYNIHRESCTWNQNFHVKGITSVKDCQEECVKDPDCNFFTWNSPDFWKANRRNTCWLQASKGTIKQDCGKRCSGKISGPKICNFIN